MAADRVRVRVCVFVCTRLWQNVTRLLLTVGVCYICRLATGSAAAKHHNCCAQNISYSHLTLMMG